MAGSDGSQPARFAELLQQVANEHAREVGWLRKEIEALKLKQAAGLSASAKPMPPPTPAPIEMEPPPLPEGMDGYQESEVGLDSDAEEDARSQDSQDSLQSRSALIALEEAAANGSSPSVSSRSPPAVHPSVFTGSGVSSHYLPDAPDQHEHFEGRASIDTGDDAALLPVLPSQMPEAGDEGAQAARPKVSFKEEKEDDEPKRPSRLRFADDGDESKESDKGGNRKPGAFSFLPSPGDENGESPRSPNFPKRGNVSFSAEHAQTHSFDLGSASTDDLCRSSTEDFSSEQVGQTYLGGRVSMLGGGGGGRNDLHSYQQRFKILKEWTGHDHHISQRVSCTKVRQSTPNAQMKYYSRQESKSMALMYSLASTMFQEGGSRCGWRVWQKILNSGVGHPTSRFNFIMDGVCLFLLTFDLAVIPFDCFRVRQGPFLAVWFIVSSLYWTFDLTRKFFTGFYRQGTIILDFKSVVLHYTRRWFVMDLAILCTDWWAVHAHDFAGRQLDTEIRILHGLRLLRVLGVRRFMKTFDDAISSELIMVTWTMGKLFAYIVAVIHFLACCWYGIGRFSNAGPNWVENYLEGGPHEEEFSYRYLTSYHWALTQFTPASISVQPHNVYERCFNVVVLLFALVTVSTLMSGINAAVMRRKALHAEKNKQFWHLRKYLKEHSVPASIAVRVTNYCNFAYEQKSKRVKEDNVKLLQMLSPSLLAELRTSIYEPSVQHHPFFVLMSRLCTLSFQALCFDREGMSFIEHSKGDSLFCVGQTCHRMYFVSAGSYNYSLHGDEAPDEINPTDWLSEAALWTHWSNKGTCQAKKECQVAVVATHAFCKAMRAHQDSLEESMQYGEAFLHGLNRVALDKLSDLYKSPKVEGLWFRLLQEPQEGGRRSSWNARMSRKSTHRLTTTSDIRVTEYIPAALGRMKQSVKTSVRRVLFRTSVDAK